jgi:type II secretory pathway pseudopilin PulG
LVKLLRILQNQRGMTLLVVIFMVVVLGLAMGMTGMVWKTVVQRDREEQLLWVGNQYRLAIESYANAMVGQGGQVAGAAAVPTVGQQETVAAAYPSSLDDLLKDPRFPGTVRHIRKLYKDPMTGKDFELIRAGGTVTGLTVATAAGGIMGVVSTSKEEPFKKSGFAEEYKDFDNASSYQDWQFVFKPGQQGQVPQAGAANRLPGNGNSGSPFPPLPGTQPRQPGAPQVPGSPGQPGQPLSPTQGNAPGGGSQ